MSVRLVPPATLAVEGKQKAGQKAGFRSELFNGR
jgi:hypothetical protein